MQPSIAELLEQARAARLAGDGASALIALRSAATLPADPATTQLALWRWAKGEFDFGTPESLLEAIEAVVALEAPFEHYPKALPATERIARRIWDNLGYRSDAVLRLWAHWGAVQRARGDNYLAAQADLQRAWHVACRGDLDAVVRISEPWLALTPGRFGRGPTKHPDAEDATLSLYWVQADLARTVLRAATWTGRQRAALDARDQLEDALALAGRALNKAPWCLDAICRAADRFEWSAPWSAWEAALHQWSTRHPAHSRLGGAVMDRRDGRADRAVGGFEAAAELAERERIGFEWIADALSEAQRTTPDENRAARLAELRARTGVGVG